MKNAKIYSCKCDFCPKQFSHRTARRRHHNKEHEEEYKAKQAQPVTTGRTCGSCQQKSADIYKLCEHVEQFHGFKAPVMSTEFPTLSEFKLWKASAVARKGGRDFKLVMIQSSHRFGLAV